MSKLKPTNDFIFKEIFGKNENVDILKDFLQSILTDIKINKVEINKDVTLERELWTDKYGILDILATLDDDIKVNVEIQVEDYHNTEDRSVFYSTATYRNDIERGTTYLNIPRSISIWITAYDVFKEGPFHEIARLRRDYNKDIISDKLEIHYIQLPKFKESCKEISNKLDEWLTFIQYDDKEKVKMIKNEHVQKAEKEYEYLTGDAAKRRIAYLREKKIRDEASGLEMATIIGKKEGIKEGKKENQIEIAKKMLAKQMDIKEIAEITELTEEDIKKL